MNRQYELPSEENLVSQEMMLKRQEQEMQRLQAQMAHRRFKLSLYPGDLPRASMLDVTRDPLRDIALETTLTQRKLKVVVVLHINPKAKKVVPVRELNLPMSQFYWTGPFSGQLIRLITIRITRSSNNTMLRCFLASV